MEIERGFRKVNEKGRKKSFQKKLNILFFIHPGDCKPSIMIYLRKRLMCVRDGKVLIDFYDNSFLHIYEAFLIRIPKKSTIL